MKPSHCPTSSGVTPVSNRSAANVLRSVCGLARDSRDSAKPAASINASTERSMVALCIGRPEGDAGNTRFPASSERRRSASHASSAATANGDSRVRRVISGFGDSIMTQGEPTVTQLTVSVRASPVFNPPPRNTAINARSRRSLQRCAVESSVTGENRCAISNARSWLVRKPVGSLSRALRQAASPSWAINRAGLVEASSISRT